MHTEFRHGSKTDKQYTYFQPKFPTNFNTNFDHIAATFKLKTYKILPEENFFAIYPDTYNYNPCFSFIQTLDSHTSLPYQYSYCTNNTPQISRVYASQIDSQESTKDLARVIKINDYKDLPANAGEITDMFVNFDSLYITTSRSIFQLPLNSQSILTEDSSIYIGSGNIFPAHPKELKNSQNSFGGQSHFKSRTQTEYGTFYMDSASGIPFLLSDTLNDISLSSLRNFFQQNGPVLFLSQFENLTSERFLSPNLIGYSSTYDPRFKRLIINKKDFSILPEHQSKFKYKLQVSDTPLVSGITTPLTLWYNSHNFYYNDNTGTPQLVTIEDPTYFENLSFTISYSFLSSHFVSFHSYLPYYLFNSSENFYSCFKYSPTESSIFEHSSLQYQTYYGTKYSHIVDLVLKNSPLERKTNSSIYYSARSSFFDSVLKQFRSVPSTYTSFIAYNTNQSTGELTLNLKNESFEQEDSTSISLLSLTDNYFRINNLRDLVISPQQPIWDSSHASLSSTPFSFLDKKPNLSNIDFNKSSFESPRLKDNYLGVRFFHNPSQDYKITLDLITTQTQNKNR
jgi:hypothetical protein